LGKSTFVKEKSENERKRALSGQVLNKLTPTEKPNKQTMRDQTKPLPQLREGDKVGTSRGHPIFYFILF